MVGALHSSSSVHGYSLCQKRTCRSTHKCGVELPTSVSHSKKLDQINGNTLWPDSINREMENLKVTFDFLEDRAEIVVSHKKASGHLVFDVRMTLK